MRQVYLPFRDREREAPREPATGSRARIRRLPGPDRRLDVRRRARPLAHHWRGGHADPGSRGQKERRGQGRSLQEPPPRQHYCNPYRLNTEPASKLPPPKRVILTDVMAAVLRQKPVPLTTPIAPAAIESAKVPRYSTLL